MAASCKCCACMHYSSIWYIIDHGGASDCTDGSSILESQLYFTDDIILTPFQHCSFSISAIIMLTWHLFLFTVIYHHFRVLFDAMLSLIARFMHSHHCCKPYRLHLFDHGYKVSPTYRPHLQVATVSLHDDDLLLLHVIYLGLLILLLFEV